MKVIERIDKLARKTTKSQDSETDNKKGYQFRKKVQRALPRAWKAIVNNYFLGKDKELETMTQDEYYKYLIKILERTATDRYEFKIGRSRDKKTIVTAIVKREQTIKFSSNESDSNNEIEVLCKQKKKNKKKKVLVKVD